MAEFMVRNAFATLLPFALAGCTGGENSFLSVQFCLTEANGVNELKQTLREIARDETMIFGDRSAEAEEELRSIGNVPKEIVRSFPLIVVNLENSEFGVGGGNMSLGPNQVALGFGPDSTDARAFATRTVRRLQETWNVVRTPVGQGAFPLKCPV